MSGFAVAIIALFAAGAGFMLGCIWAGIFPDLPEHPRKPGPPPLYPHNAVMLEIVDAYDTPPTVRERVLFWNTATREWATGHFQTPETWWDDRGAVVADDNVSWWARLPSGDTPITRGRR